MERQADDQSDSGGKELHEQDKDRALRHLMKTLEAVNDRLRESESLKTNFLSNIRNEINNPLTSIMYLSQQIMEERNPALSTIRKTFGLVYAEAFDLDFQLRNLFAAAEIEAGEHTLGVSNVDIDVVIQNTIRSFKHRMDQKNIEIIYSYEELNASGEKRLFKTDSGKLKLVLSNLLSNAIEFSEDSGIIELEAKRDGENVTIAFRDYGIGFHMDYEKVIFERFRQLDTGARRKHRGHGLGLSITKDLIDLLGGTISATSAQGKETLFAVSIHEAEPAAGTDVFSDDGNVFIF